MAGLLRSDDGGRTWVCEPVAGDEDIHHVTAHPDDPDLIYVSLGTASLLHREGEHGGVARSRDGGRTWEKVETDYTRASLVPAARPDLLLAGPAPRVGAEGRIVVSADGGDSWEPAGDGIDVPMPDMVELFVDAPDGERVGDLLARPPAARDARRVVVDVGAAGRRRRHRQVGGVRMTTFRLAGVDVPRIGLGTNRLRAEHVGFIRDAVAAGVRHIDTAHLYTGGESERTIGEALEGVDEEVLVATKGGFRGARPEVLHAEIEQSLRSLRTEAIGLYYLHRVDPGHAAGGEPRRDQGARRPRRDPPRRRLRGERRADRAGPPGRADRRRPEQYNLADRGHDDVVDHCEREGIAFVPYYPLGGGRLGVRTRRSSSPGCCGARRSSCRSRARSRSSTCARTSRCSRTPDNHERARERRDRDRRGGGHEHEEPPAAGRAARAAVVVQRGEADEHAEPQEPRLVEQEVPQELRGLVAPLPAAELQLDDAERVERLGHVRRQRVRRRVGRAR